MTVYQGKLRDYQMQLYNAALMEHRMRELTVACGGVYGEGVCFDEVTFPTPEAAAEFERRFREEFPC